MVALCLRTIAVITKKDRKMGVSFTWKPTDPTIGTSWGSGSRLNMVMQEAFGEFPITLTVNNIQKLEGIAACGYADIQELIAAILDCDSIKVEAHW